MNNVQYRQNYKVPISGGQTTMLLNDVTIGSDVTYNVLAKRLKVEQLLERVCHLHKDDRLIVEQLFRHGLSIAQVATLIGRSRQHVRRRLNSIVERVRTPLFAYTILYRDLLPLHVQQTARLVVLQGQSLRRTSEITGYTLHEVRQHMRVVRAMARV